MASSQGVSDVWNVRRFASKYAECEGWSAERFLAMAVATFGIVVGSYQRWGFGVLPGSPSRPCTTITRRLELGEADSIRFMKPSYPRPFCTMSWAALTSSATLGLDSNVCGSVLGLLRIASTWTYRPPICDRTLAYSFSAPMALITPAEEVCAAPPHPAATIASTAAAAQTRAPSRRPES